MKTLNRSMRRLVQIVDEEYFNPFNHIDQATYEEYLRDRAASRPACIILDLNSRLHK